MTDQKVALVTGGSRGIGQAISLELARNGYVVLINFRSNFDEAEKTRHTIAEAGGTAEICQGDVADPSNRDLLIDFTMQTFGRLDLLVNNAGIGPKKRTDILETDLDTYNRILATNLTGPYFLAQKAARVMIALLADKRIQTPSIVNISSIRAYTAAGNYGEYCISKAGLSMVTKLLAVRLAEHGINVYEIRPGVIDTDMTRRPDVRAYYDERLAKGMVPINRLGTPEEVAKAVAMIARGDLPFSTGEVINVDGGWHLRWL
ncbi:MAG TPA: 3-ketoacyl-ACP reductase [Phycisphaerae bacterium]|nr:3-ketoacyl-ACP reductase [Phycisphaerae bacterium]